MDFLTPYYGAIVYNLAFFLSLACAFSQSIPDRFTPLYFRQSLSQRSGALIVFAVIVTLWWGLREPTFAFGDTGNYAEGYRRAATMVRYPINSDRVFETILLYFARAGVNIRLWFLFIEIIYIGCHAKMCEKLFGNKAFFAFILVFSAFQFYPFGFNGIRNGMGVALMLPAIYYIRKHTWLAVIFILLAVNTHSSVYLVAAALILTCFVKRTEVYLGGWAVCLVAAIVGGQFFENLFLASGIINTGHDLDYFKNENYDLSGFARTGFRWDFLAYGVIPIIWGWFFIIKKKFKDVVFVRLVNIYITCNAFWLLVNQNWLSNRFAYLSWFLYAFILAYPILRMEYLPNRRTWFGLTMIGNAAFTYFMFLVGKI